MVRKTIRDIHITKKPVHTDIASEVPATPRTKSVQKKPVQPTEYTNSYHEHHSVGNMTWLWITLALVIVGLVVWTIFGKAKIIITPDTATTEGAVTVLAYQDAPAGSLEYETMTLEDKLSKSIPAGDATFVEEKASGTIIVYNETTTAQRFTEETRFESDSGLIFKLPKGPGITVPAGKKGAPGSVEAVVYADKAGAEYNIDLVDFVIPGWRESKSPKFTTQYARSKTPMTGGFSGTKRIVSEDDKKNTADSLEVVITERLHKEAPAQIPQDFVFFKNLSVVNFAPINAVDEEKEARVSLEAQGTLYGIILRRDVLSQMLARELVSGYNDEPILVTNFQDLSVKLVSPAILTTEATALRFTVTGTPQFEWQINSKNISEKLSGTSRKEFNTNMASFIGIKSAVLKMYPFWLRKIPSDRIVIKIDD